jgi:hypothetical protein
VCVGGGGGGACPKKGRGGGFHSPTPQAARSAAAAAAMATIEVSGLLAVAHYERGGVLRALGRNAEAVAAYDEAVRARNAEDEAAVWGAGDDDGGSSRQPLEKSCSWAERQRTPAVAGEAQRCQHLAHDVVRRPSP